MLNDDASGWGTEGRYIHCKMLHWTSVSLRREKRKTNKYLFVHLGDFILQKFTLCAWQVFMSIIWLVMRKYLLNDKYYYVYVYVCIYIYLRIYVFKWYKSWGSRFENIIIDNPSFYPYLIEKCKLDFISTIGYHTFNISY